MNNLNYGDVSRFSFHVQAERKKKHLGFGGRITAFRDATEEKIAPSKKYLQTGPAAYEYERVFGMVLVFFYSLFPLF